MAIFDASVSSAGFNMFLISAIDFNAQDGLMNSTGYSWLSDDGHDIVLTGSGFTYSGATVTGGTVINGFIDLGNVGGDDIVITGIPNGSLVDMTNGGASGNMPSFYSNILSGNDSVIGSAFADNLKGAGGDDSITGGAGADTINGDAGNDTLDGGSGADSLNGGSNNDSLIGGSNSDTLNGGSGNDTLAGGFGTDNVNGEAGNDFIFIFDGEFIDNVDGGADMDTLNLTNIVTPGEQVTIDMGAGTFSGFGGARTIANIETVVGTQLNDTITGGAADEHLIGGGGDDLISGFSGQDTLNGGAGNDTVDFSYTGSRGNINLSTSTANFPTFFVEDIFNFENVIGTQGDDTITGDSGANVLTGGSGNDTIRGEDGDDQLFLGFGDDRGEGGLGADLIRSGPGSDTLLGGNGNDTLGASNASDLLRGQVGNDLMLGSNGNDRLFGDSGADTLLGGNGRDTLDGGVGADVINGGGNTGDLVTYEASSTGVFVRLWAGDGVGGDAQGDTLTDVEFLRGSAFDDTLHGTNDLNRIEGGAGNDLILGLAGTDFLVGGAGADTLTGGSGDDQFWHVQGDGADTITDFTAGPGDDLVRLFGYGAAFDTFGEVIGASSQVGSNVVINFGGGDIITLENTTLASLTTADFMFG